MGVKQSRLAELLENRWDDSWVESGSPRGGVDPNPGDAEPLRQLTPARCNYNLIDTEVLELSGEEPNLPLATSPLST